MYSESKFESLYLSFVDIEILLMENGQPKVDGMNIIHLDRLAVYLHDLFEAPGPPRLPTHFFRAPITPILWVYIHGLEIGSSPSENESTGTDDGMWSTSMKVQMTNDWIRLSATGYL